MADLEINKQTEYNNDYIKQLLVTGTACLCCWQRAGLLTHFRFGALPV